MADATAADLAMAYATVAGCPHECSACIDCIATALATVRADERASIRRLIAANGADPRGDGVRVLRQDANVLLVPPLLQPLV